MTIGEGALFFYGNLGATATSVNYTNITNGDFMLDPQLSPKATLDAQSHEIEFVIPEWDDTYLDPPKVEAIGLFGLEGFFDGNGLGIEDFSVLVEEEGASGTFIVSNETIIMYPNDFQPGSIILVLDVPIAFNRFAAGTKIRIAINFASTPPNPPKIGFVRLGKVLQDPELADRGYRMSFRDVSNKNETRAGQQFNGSSNVLRVMELDHSSVSRRNLLGLPVRGQDVTDIVGAVTPTLTGTFNSSTFPVYNWDISNSIQIEFASALPADSDFIADVSLKIKGGDLNQTNIPTGSFKGKALDLGRRSMTFSSGSSAFLRTLSVSVSSVAGYPAGTELEMTIINIQKVDDDATVNVDQSIRSLSQLILESGTSQPVAVVLRPDMPDECGFSGMVGTIENFRPYVDRGGQITGGGLTIKEIR